MSATSRPARKVHLSINTQKAGPSLTTDPTDARKASATMAPEENLKYGESWEKSFARAPAAIPSEIMPGLYLGNCKSAASYLLGKVDETYPHISRIVTVYNLNMSRHGYANFPEAKTAAAEKIQRLIIEKTDRPETNLLEDFDRTGEFIHSGVQAYQQAQRRNDTINDQDPITSLNSNLKKLQINTKRSRSSSNSSTTSVSTPVTPVASLNRLLKARTTTSTLATEFAKPIFSRSASTYNVAEVPYDASLMLKPSTSTDAAQEQAPAPSGPGGVLVHCHAGVSRSSTVVVAYLLKYHKAFLDNDTSFVDAMYPAPSSRPYPTDELVTDNTVDRAIVYVHSRRGIICPNLGFRTQLQTYHNELGCSLTDPATGKVSYGYMDWLEMKEAEEAEWLERQRQKAKSSSKAKSKSVFSDVDDEGNFMSHS